MSGHFASLIQHNGDALMRAYADEIYRERRTDLPELLSYGQLVDHLPEALEEMARVIGAQSDDAEIKEIVRRLRSHAQVRFQQGVLIDEVARELTVFRQVINDFLWREHLRAAEGGLREFYGALRRANLFVDEMLTQTVVIYAASLRPPVETRTSVWPPPRRRKTDFPESDDAP